VNRMVSGCIWHGMPYFVDEHYCIDDRYKDDFRVRMMMM